MRLLMLALLGLALAAGPATAQDFDSTSSGDDEALEFADDAGTVVWDPSTATRDDGSALDPEGDNVFHFTTIDIPEGVTVQLIASNFGGEGRPVVWLATGDVTIAGTLDLEGAAGHSSSDVVRVPSEPGAGGWSGGAAPIGIQQNGNGPGGGQFVVGSIGRGAGHRTVGFGGGEDAAPAYGNRYLLPLLGGSGGAAGALDGDGDGYGGGAGGGAILIASSGTITVSGEITVRGGAGVGTGTARSGGGSGGSLRLVASTLEGDGTLDARGGPAFHPGSTGRMRLQAFENTLVTDATVFGTRTVSLGTPGLLFPPDNSPTVKITGIDGVDAPTEPTGRFDTVDVEIDAATEVTIDLEASNVPTGTVVQVRLFSEDAESEIVESTELEGTLESSTATATVTFPAGFTRVTVSATWTPE